MRTILILLAFSSASISPAALAQNASQQLHKLFEAEWQRKLKENPTYASQLGDTRYAHLWPDVSLTTADRSALLEQEALRQARAIAPKDLSEEDRLNRRLFIRQYESEIRRCSHRLHLIPLNQRGGIQNASSVADQIPFDTPEDYEKWIRRLEAFPAHMAQTMAAMTQGMREGMLHPKVVMERIPSQIKRQLVDKPESSLFYKPFFDMPPDIPDAEQRRLQRTAARTITKCVLPSYRVFLEFFESQYLPACFEHAGCWQRPNGQQMYADLAKYFTTTSMTPDEIHDTGLAEVRRIRGQMEAIQTEVKYAGSFQEFLHHLRSDPKYYYDNANDLLTAYRECCQRIDPKLPQLFHKLPDISYEVQPVPSQLAADTTTAYYQPPSANGNRPGTYFVNLYRPDMRPKYEIEALSLH